MIDKLKAGLALQPTQAGAAYYAAERERLHEEMVTASALIEYGLKKDILHLRDRAGRLITHFDEWLAAVVAGEWP